VDDRGTSTTPMPEMLEEALVEQLRDMLHAEGQLVKALPKMAEAAGSDLLRMAFEKHLEETREQVTRLKEVFSLLGVEAKPKPCKGMAGLIEEGQEAIDEAGEEGDVGTDLALIASAQKVEHYEISAYGTARTMAGQIGRPDVAQLLATTLAEEQVSDSLLTQVARELMAQTRTGVTKEETLTRERD
jgi:Mn-containing catalase